MLVNDGQKHRGFRKNIFNDGLFLVGISAGPHQSAQTVVQFEYAKGLTDYIPPELMKKMESMGINTKRLA